MQAIDLIQLDNLTNTFISLAAAFILGGIIGLERQYRQRTAGLRTNVLVAVGAALFVDIAVRFHEIHGGVPGAMHVMAYVVSGVGFLGAGVIMREEGSIRGLNTAATLWASAAVGIAAGADLILEALLATLFILSANTLLRPVVNAINRAPVDSTAVETTNTVYVVTPREHRKQALAVLEQMLDVNGYPIRDVEVHPFGTTEVEIEATLVSTSVDGDELDRLIEKLAENPFIAHVFWTPSTVE
ncbi:MAG: MgtC/SapB family protein [Thioalkalivibrionaceae bacterium]